MNEDKNANKIISLAMLQYMALFFMIFSSSCLIIIGWEVFFNGAEYGTLPVAFHLYGFCVSNLILIFIPKAKRNCEENEDA
jgi:hypothetical protein